MSEKNVLEENIYSSRNMHGLNKNNYEIISADEFIEIVSGQKVSYTFPPTSNGAAYYQIELEESKKSGRPFRHHTVSIPAHSEFSNGYYLKSKIEVNNTVPDDHKKDLGSPIVTTIKGGVYWNRGQNSSDDSSKKSKLLYPISSNNCWFNNSVEFREINTVESFTLSNCQFITESSSKENNSFKLINSSFTSVVIKHLSAFNESSEIIPVREVIITQLKTNYLLISNSCVNELTINCLEDNIETIIFHSCTINKLTIIGTNFGECRIINPIKMGEVKIEAEFRKLLIVGDIDVLNPLKYHFSIETLSLKLLSGSKGQVVFKGINFEKIFFEGVSSNEILLRESVIGNLHFNEFSNQHIIRLQNIVCTSTFIVTDSALGKAEFLNCNLLKTKVIKIHQSSIEEISLNNTNFPNSIIAHNVKDYEGIREAYRQLKYASAKHGNRINELKYQAYEMDAYFKSLAWYSGDKWILTLNYISTNYGQNWRQGFLVTAFFGGITYLIYCLSLGFSLGSDTELFWKLTSYSLEYLNPLHKPDYIVDNLNIKNSNRSVVWENISRVINGFFIYQMVQAFRKFGKSSS